MREVSSQRLWRRGPKPNFQLIRPRHMPHSASLLALAGILGYALVTLLVGIFT